jgi:phosphoribosylformimino-5-aminoimidazole carboxamide ribotide isomerase
MAVLAVLDLMHGQVVRGVAGRRHEYRPIVSKLTTSADPCDVARALRDHFGLADLYVADLDAIGGAQPAVGVFTALNRLGFTLAVDAGLRTARDAGPLLAAGVTTIVAGLETLAEQHVLHELVEQVGAEQLVFSLDLKDGQPMAVSPSWKGSAWDIAGQAVGMGVRRLLILDLTRVGTSSGTGTEELCSRLAATFPHVALLAGGGIRDRDDLDRLSRLGVKGVLVASALHDGRLTRADVAS